MRKNSNLKIQPSIELEKPSFEEIKTNLQGKKTAVGVIGLGYVGLPLACHLAKHFRVLGHDINKLRIAELNRGEDSTREVEDISLLSQKTISFSSDPQDLSDCNLFIVAVPTPVDKYNRPDLLPLISASRSIGKVIKPGAIVVFESTVYPGVTEDVCRRVIEDISGLKFNVDFYLGYSPERINPGDRIHTVDKIMKVVSGSTPEALELLSWFYGKLTTGGIHRAPSLKVAEAAKISENIQRDVNIALINELAVIYGAMGISINDVLDAASTKWNFLKFYPGIVGGHCIGVDPYYLTHVAEKLKIPATIVSSSREVNESMPRHIAQQALQAILKEKISQTETPLTIGILGAAFKENVPDTRNTKVVDLAEELEKFGCNIHIVDENADKEEFSEEYGRELCAFESLPKCHALIIAVKHDTFVKNFSAERLKTKLKAPYVIFDVKKMLEKEEANRLGLNLRHL